ncbi:MAG: YihY/virulence factor BrkB family protein [Desulfovibrio sp.]|nr:YihY/virulence factor BrkB family protein [Desulfovibrio sp.]MBI4959963.1 YihY/virulence factor BrkB family protein [Desulfovibrio sp.]
MQNPTIIFPWLHFVAASFLRNRSLSLASSLGYTTVLSLVPFLAVAFSVAKGFGIYEAAFLREVLMRLFAEKADVVDAVLGYIQNTNVKALGFIGVATLFITSVSLLSTMEEAFNIIWHAKEKRGIWSRFSNYITVILVCPVFILAAFSVTATLENASVVQWLREISLVNQAFTLGVKAVPMVMVIISLFILYKFLPNVRVSSFPALAGAACAGFAWQSTQALYIKYQIGVTGYNAIYGSFAQIPLLLVWLYISWLIVLAGAEIANASQNFQRIHHENSAKSYSFADRRDLALILALMLTERAENKEPPLSDAAAALPLGVPVRLVVEELKKLVRLGFAVKVNEESDSEHYVLAAAPDKITVGELIVAWEGLRGEDQNEGIAERYPALAAVKERLNASCLEGSTQTLREVWLAMPEDKD